MDLGTHQENVLVLTRPDPRIGDGQSVDEPTALIADVDGGNFAEVELALQEDAVAGLEVIGCAGAVDDAVDVGRREPRFVERLLGRFTRERDARVTLVYPVARLDAAALHDPLIGRVHDLREIVVTNDDLAKIMDTTDEWI